MKEKKKNRKREEGERGLPTRNPENKQKNPINGQNCVKMMMTHKYMGV